MENIFMRRGEIWLINLDPTIGAEIKKTRPANWAS
jgi:mRNA interferase MazF